MTGPIEITNEGMDDAEFIKCLRYVMMYEFPKDGKKTTLQNVADEFGITTMGLYKMRARWTRTGLLEKVRRYASSNAYEEVELAVDAAVRAVPQMLYMLINDATNPKIPHRDRHSALKMVMEMFVKPRQASIPPDNTDEEMFLKLEAGSFNPIFVQPSEQSFLPTDDHPTDPSESDSPDEPHTEPLHQ